MESRPCCNRNVFKFNAESKLSFSLFQSHRLIGGCFMYRLVTMGVGWSQKHRGWRRNNQVKHRWQNNSEKSYTGSEEDQVLQKLGKRPFVNCGMIQKPGHRNCLPSKGGELQYLRCVSWDVFVTQKCCARECLLLTCLHVLLLCIV